MRGPENLYEVAARCFDCHLIVDEELQEAGHGIGAGFELMNALQGEVRHNFVRGAGTNAVASPERRRTLFLFGLLLEMQYTLQALETVRPESNVAGLVVERAKLARTALGRAAELVSLPAFGETDLDPTRGRSARPAARPGGARRTSCRACCALACKLDRGD